MWLNPLCTYEANCAAQQERARLRAVDLYARLANIPEGGELRSVAAIRNALAYCAGAIEAMLGLKSAMSWADILDKDPLQKVNAMHIRKIVRLQQGDPEGAERFRKQAEVLAAQASSRQMFTNTLTLELSAYALANDLTGVKQVAAAIEPLAARYPGWLPFRHIAEGHFQRLCGNREAALAAYDRCLALNERDLAEPWRSIATWPRAMGCRIDVLVDLGRFAEARSAGERALERASQLGLTVATHDIARALALAEAKLGDYTSATARLAQVIAEQKELGVSGLILGASYEARARIAIWVGDTAAVEEYGRLTAQEYRHGRGSPLGALYERLMADARRAGVRVLPQLSEFESTMMAGTRIGQRAPAAVNADVAMRAAENATARAACALALICSARGASGGHLYLLGERGLMLAASDPEPPADAALLEFAKAHLTHELEPEMATVVATETSAAQSSPSAVWTDSRGFVYRAVSITCAVAGEELCAGVVILCVGHSRELDTGAAELVASLGALLVEAGDVQAWPAQEVARRLAERETEAVR